MSSIFSRICFGTLSALALALGIGSCGKVAGNQVLLDSNTNWLMSCTEDQECNGSLRCYCGICTKPCGLDAECRLLDGARCAESGDNLCGAESSAGGLCVLACTTDATCGDGFQCSAGQCVPKRCDGTALLDWDGVFQTINADLVDQDPEDRSYFRYLDLGASGDASGNCAAAGALPLAALTKLLNSLSISAGLRLPTPIDANQRLYRIDLRDYDWDRVVTVNGRAYPDAWSAITANDPYALSFFGDDADAAMADTGTLVPVVPAASFLAAATEPGVYYGLVDIQQISGINVLDDYLQSQLGVQLDQFSFEAGFVDNGVEFLAQQWQIEVRAGNVWLLSNYGRGAGALFADPLQEPSGAHEMIFTLPNGLTAFAFMGADGQRLDGWDVTDDPAELDGKAHAPRSNWRRHPRLPAVRDEVRAQVEAHPDQYTPAGLETIRQRFRGQQELTLQLERDYFAFLGPALTRIGVDPEQPEPITAAFEAFRRPVTLEQAAAELRVTPEDLRDNLLLLPPELAPLAVGSIDRDVFTNFYAASTCALDVVLENQPDSRLCP